MTRKIKIILKYTFLKSLFLLSPAFFIVSCNQNSQETLEIRRKITDFNKKGDQLYLKDSQLVEFKEKEKIKMVALGDSLTQGFFAVPFSASPGNSNKNYNRKPYEGLSYPAVLAQYLESVQEGKIESYYNLSLSGSKVTDWNYILSPNDKRFSWYEKSAEGWIKINKSIAKNKDWGFSENYEEFFLDSSSTEKFQKIREKIKDANFIVFSLGGNTGVSFFKTKIWELVDKALAEKEIFLKKDSQKIREWIKSNYKMFQKSWMTVLDSLNDNMRHFIKKLKRLNPYASIVWVGYPFATWFLADFLVGKASSLLYEEGEKKEELSLSLWMFHRFQELAKKIAKELKVSFVSNYDVPTWTDFNLRYLGNILDFHPSVFGQRRMAQNILLKIAAPAKTLDELQESEEARENWMLSKTKEYINSDVGFFRKEVYLLPDNSKELFKKISREIGVLLQKDTRWNTEFSKNDLLPKFLNDFLRSLEFVNLRDYFDQLLSQVDVRIFQPGEQQKEFVTKTWERILSNKTITENTEKLYALFQELKNLFQNFQEEVNIDVLISQVLQTEVGQKMLDIVKKMFNIIIENIKLIFPDFSLNLKKS